MDQEKLTSVQQAYLRLAWAILATPKTKGK